MAADVALDAAALPAAPGGAAGRVAAAWQVLRGVMDPEIPVLSLVDLGIVRDVREVCEEEGAAGAGAATLVVTLTPTYSGCPATEVIEADTRMALQGAGLGPVRLERRLAPAWSTDWIGADARERLRRYGIAPPGRAAGCDAATPGAPGTPGASAGEQVLRFVPRPLPAVACPRCDSPDTERLSPFGATACKSLWRCRACREPFEHFKAL